MTTFVPTFLQFVKFRFILLYIVNAACRHTRTIAGNAVTRSIIIQGDTNVFVKSDDRIHFGQVGFYLRRVIVP